MMAHRIAPLADERKEVLPRGAYSKIARRMRPTVTPQAVRLVHIGKSVSARISAAIERFKKELEVAA